MQITNDTVVQLEYEAKLEGVVVAHTHKPKLLLIGHERDLPPGLEVLLLGKTAPLEFSAQIENAYGARDEDKVMVIEATQLPIQNPSAGAKFSATDQNGQSLEARVVAVEGSQITIDMNHPRAGKTLEYHIKILNSREADAHELEHGHAHGEGGVTHSH